jgi:N-acetylmuramoyl-L-alanine amidase
MARITTRRQNVQFLNPGPIDIPLGLKSKAINKMIAHENKKANPLKVMGLELHSNAARGRGWQDSAKGFTVWHYPGSVEGIKFSRILEAQMEANTPIPSRGLKSSRWFHMLRKPRCPMVLLEMYFHTNSIEAAWAADFENQILLGDTVGGAMDIYERISE